ncbi:hypothetical protein M0638_07095 [Roseomonas sp. NAR14]|uniref:Uncharacterized protein n=1 Tax=Roseomonas acroporae TaxID=2937791 RepID=A0A9X1YCU1_9PROT|nr:hypothetical protein [Roseomonas acroporae]MCK8784141.1 hypothetical protein [Roseomonas acroporae]
MSALALRRAATRPPCSCLTLPAELSLAELLHPDAPLPQRARIEALIAALIELLDLLDDDPNAEDGADGEEDAEAEENGDAEPDADAEASPVPLTEEDPACG